VVICGNPESNLTTQYQEIQSGTSSQIYNFTTSVATICISGFKFTDGSLSNSIQCTASGYWTAGIDCTGYAFDLQ